MTKPVILLGIESSCDETSAAVSYNDKILANIIAGQRIHEAYGGVVPELASRAHQQNIIPVIDQALKQANVNKNELSAVAFTNGPGLMGALLVGASFAKTFAMGLQIPLISVNHMQAHVLANFVGNEGHRKPKFPFICLTVSGGHTQLILVRNFLEMEVIGQTQDDAAGEAFDKIAKLLNLPYPGGPHIDKLASTGNPEAFRFPKPSIPGLNYSFSGFKTAVLYFLQKNTAISPSFIVDNLNDICASVQFSIVNILLDKLKKACIDHQVKDVALAGGVSANSGLRKALVNLGNQQGWEVFIPSFEYCTDNAAMICISGYHQYQSGQFASLDIAPFARFAGL